MEEVGKACIDELEVKVDDRCSVWSGSLYRVRERQPGLLGRHCHLEKGSFFDLHPGQFRRRRQRRRCDLVREAYWIVGESGMQEGQRKREREKEEKRRKMGVGRTNRGEIWYRGYARISYLFRYL